MTTPRIEEKYWNDKPKKIATGEGVIISLTKKEFDELVTQAHQAGIDEVVEKDDLLDDMWGLICNVNGGIVEEEREEWYEAFLRIRKKYFDHQSTTR